MGTLENGLVSTLNDSDLEVMKMISDGLTYWNEYFFQLCTFNSVLEYQEYFTLRIDFRDFYIETKNNGYKVEFKIMGSFIRSFRNLLQNLYKMLGKPEGMFKMFLIDCIVSLSMILSELVEAK